MPYKYHCEHCEAYCDTCYDKYDKVVKVYGLNDSGERVFIEAVECDVHNVCPECGFAGMEIAEVEE